VLNYLKIEIPIINIDYIIFYLNDELCYSSALSNIYFRNGITPAVRKNLKVNPHRKMKKTVTLSSCSQLKINDCRLPLKSSDKSVLISMGCIFLFIV
jgi:hypothetical protein